MTLIILLLITVLFFILSAGLFSGFETGLYVCDELTLRGRLLKRLKGAQALNFLITHRKWVVILLLLFTNISLFLASAAFTEILRIAALVKGEFLTAFLSASLFSPIVAVFAEMVPKDLFRLRSYPLLYYFAPFIYILYRPLSLLVLPFIRLTQKEKQKKTDTASLTREEVEARLKEDIMPESLLGSMVRNVFRLSGLRLKDVMVPAFVTVTINPDATKEDVMRISRIYRLSRLPVIESFESSKVLGVLHIFDMFYKNAEFVKDVMRPPLFLKEETSLKDALFLMRIHRTHLAIVTDSVGRFVGIVTIKDIVEEITGELRSW
ncbi:MAG: CNNM domain-containing protein [Planctomycetota bacterium]|nr:CNNM domain-containing protein [Planctomycetota bacterium]